MEASIPGEIARFLGNAIAALGGTRDANLVPHAHRLSGIVVEADGRTLTCLVAQGFTDHLLSSLEDNQQFVFTITDQPSHETYQLKGTYIGSRPVVESDFTIYEEFQKRYIERVGGLFGFTDEVLRFYLPPPAIGVRMTVEEIFLQTPGPSAGRRIFPQAEAEEESKEG